MRTKADITKISGLVSSKRKVDQRPPTIMNTRDGSLMAAMRAYRLRSCMGTLGYDFKERSDNPGIQGVFRSLRRGLPNGENDCYLGLEYSRVGSGKRASEWCYSQSYTHLLHYISISKMY